MWVSLVATASSEQRKYIASSKKVTNVLPSVVNKTVVEFEESTDNSVRSVKVQYCKGLISKEKYKKRQRVCMKSNEKSAPRRSIKFSGMKIPKFFLMIISFPKSVEIGTVMDMKSEFCGKMNRWKELSGNWKNFSLNWPICTFMLTAWILCFINVGEGVASQNESFLLAGVSCYHEALCKKISF